MGVYAISGCPRSGTSLMMSCFSTSLGHKRLIGYKFPQEEKINRLFSRNIGETENQYVYRLYCLSKIGKTKTSERARLTKAYDMNPGGFWEHPQFTCGGLRYLHNHRGQINRILSARKPLFIKIVSQGLLPSDPRYISKIVFMVRHPFAVAKSQERLTRQGMFKDESGKTIDIFSDVVINSPDMFLQVSLAAAKFFLSCTHIPVHMVDFDDLIETPAPVLESIQDFLGEGNFSLSVDNIDPKLRRSYSPGGEENIWAEAENVYKRLKNKDFTGIVKTVGKDLSEYRKRQESWLCARTQTTAVRAHCVTCKSSAEFRKSLINYATSRGFDWKNEPCAFECAYDKENPLISIEESIATNFWEGEKDETKRSGVGTRRPPGITSLRCTREFTGL